MFRHVVLLRRDPSLGLALRALLHGTGRVTELPTLQAWSTLPPDDIDAVVIDLPVPRRKQAVDLVRSRFNGRLVLVLEPTDDPGSVPPDRGCSVVQRPFEIVELWHLVTTDPTPSGSRGGRGRAESAGAPAAEPSGRDAGEPVGPPTAQPSDPAAGQWPRPAVTQPREPAAGQPASPTAGGPPGRSAAEPPDRAGGASPRPAAADRGPSPAGPCSQADPGAPASPERPRPPPTRDRPAASATRGRPAPPE